MNDTKKEGYSSYCKPCDRFFQSESILNDHIKTKKHKYNYKISLERPYTQKDAENAAGLF